MENVTVKCANCGHRNRVRVAMGQHSKNDDDRYYNCQTCGSEGDEFFGTIE